MSSLATWLFLKVYLVYATAISIKVALPDANTGEAVAKWIPQFERETGHTVQAVMIPREELPLLIESDLKNESSEYAVYEWTLGDIGTFGPYLMDITRQVLTDRTKLRWYDIAAFFRDSGGLYDNNIVGIPLDGDFLFMHYRKDILDRDREPPPTTLEEMVRLAIQYNGTDLNEDGEPDYGFCHILSAGTPSFDMLMMGYYGSAFQTKGTSDGVLFDPTDMNSLIHNELFGQIMGNIKRALHEGSYFEFMVELVFDVRQVFLSGRCMFLLDWLDIPFLLVTPNISGKHMTKYDPLSRLPWVSSKGPHGSRVGTSAPPGHKQVWNREKRLTESCNSELCPYATNGTNRPIFAASGGWGLMMNGALSIEEAKVAYDFMAFVASPHQSLVDVLDGSTGFEPFRYSQLSWRLWAQQGMDENYAQQLATTETLLFDGPNVIREPPLPGNGRYHIASAKYIFEFLNNEIDASTMIQRISEEWNDIHASYGGKQAQLLKYRTGMGLPILEEIGHQKASDDLGTRVITLIWSLASILLLACLVCIWRMIQLRRQSRLEKNIRFCLSDKESRKSIPWLQAALEQARRFSLKALAKDLQRQLSIQESRYTELDALHQIVEECDLQLVKGSWLASRSSGNRFLRQQDMPDIAVWNSHKLFLQLGTISIVAVSYSWLHHVHPDPKGQHLNIIRHALKLRLRVRGLGQVTNVALFLDYCSIAQKSEKGDPDNPEPGEDRTLKEQESFKRALTVINIPYANQRTETWILQWTPADFQGNGYEHRAWPFFEKTISSLVKHSSQLLCIDDSVISCDTWADVFHHRFKRSAPYSPQMFRDMIANKSVTNGDDLDILIKVYDSTFSEVIGKAVILWFVSQEWDDLDAERLAAVLPFCTNLQEILLSDNKFTSLGAMCLVKAALHCEDLIAMDLTENAIEKESQSSIRVAWREGGKPAQGLHLLGGARQSFADIMSSRSGVSSETLRQSALLEEPANESQNSYSLSLENAFLVTDTESIHSVEGLAVSRPPCLSTLAWQRVVSAGASIQEVNAIIEAFVVSKEHEQKNTSNMRGRIGQRNTLVEL